jgi:hypothetical protein
MLRRRPLASAHRRERRGRPRDGLGRFFRAQYAREKLLADAEVATKLCQWPRGHYHGELPARASLKGADLTDTNLTREQFDSAITDKDTMVPSHIKRPGKPPGEDAPGEAGEARAPA